MLSLLKSFARSISSSDENSLPVQQSQPHTHSDRMEDGFLLVGQTRSERTTVYTDRFDNNVGAPPQYGEIRQSEDPLPSYKEYTSNVVQYSPHPTPPQGQDANFSEDQMNLLVTGSKSAIADVPFVLACDAGILNSLQELKAGFFLWQNHFCVEKYDYDFTVELSFLKEFGGDIHFEDGKHFENSHNRPLIQF